MVEGSRDSYGRVENHRRNSRRSRSRSRERERGRKDRAPKAKSRSRSRDKGKELWFEKSRGGSTQGRGRGRGRSREGSSRSRSKGASHPPPSDPTKETVVTKESIIPYDTYFVKSHTLHPDTGVVVPVVEVSSMKESAADNVKEDTGTISKGEEGSASGGECKDRKRRSKFEDESDYMSMSFVTEKEGEKLKRKRSSLSALASLPLPGGGSSYPSDSHDSNYPVDPPVIYPPQLPVLPVPSLLPGMVAMSSFIYLLVK
jgi:hypothetical protein